MQSIARAEAKRRTTEWGIGMVAGGTEASGTPKQRGGAAVHNATNNQGWSG
jgi:hypothetical protein